nr:DNA polymerase III subunit gamma and tau [Aeromicrobium stalagmiti]
MYRRYRPETFAEVIGQEHVTEPLRHALAGNRVNHAYLFSGPRGCGKTTSARILARALNCEKAPIADPCGECQSCRDLARGGPGSIDVIEIDAASHGGVDDARDLRERAFFAPVSSRYKVYIIDEAHMVSPQGFNALLKLVEEPPPHLKFIFATTEPDKVIGTIRSRTHHYPFRLVPPKALGDYLLQLCEAEGVALAPTALPLVVRAGQGSVRDTLSVLDQLLGGAGPEGVTYDLAVQLLGYTPDSLLDEAIDAFAASDGSTVFGVVDKVIESGQDPRRFAEDLLQRLRDLVIVAAVPDALDKGLLDVPGDRAERLVTQANGFGPSELTRAADIVNAALMEFRGATAPRLLLELMCARILVPGADNSTQGFQARLDRVERRLSMDGGSPTPARPAPAAAPVHEPVHQPEPEPEPAPVVPPVQAEPAPVAPPVAAEPAPVAPPQPVASPQPVAPAAAPAGTLTIADVRRLWPEILDKIRDMRRFAWIMLSQNAQVMALDGQVLTIALVNAGARDSFVNSGSADYVQKALQEVLGVTWRIEAIVDPGARPGVVDDYDDGPSTPPPVEQPSAPSAPAVAVPDSVRQAMREQHSPQTREDPDASADRDDPVVDHEILDPELLLSRELGAEVIDETPTS